MYGPGRMGYVGGGPRMGRRWGSRHGPPARLVFGLVFGGMVLFFVAGARERGKVDDGRKEKELLEALARHGELTPARAALETSLGVAEADRMLSGLAKDGHIELRAREGRLEYALWDADRRELTA
jgi:hypothetical protein